MMEHKVANYPF